MRVSRGFTLIEVMITVAIVAILASIALPSYSEYMRRSRITDATSALAGMRVKMEQYFQDNRSYVGACAANTVAPLPAATSNFSFECPLSDLTASTYLIKANGQGSMSGFTYTINQNNVRASPNVPTGWTSSTTCWVLKKDGSC